MIHKAERAVLEIQITEYRGLSRHMPDGISKLPWDARVVELEKKLREIDE
jgi:hypothetical protein